MATVLLFVRHEAASQDEPPADGLLRGPYLQNLTEEAVEIVWVTSGLEGIGAVRLERPDRTTTTVEDSDALTCEALRDDDPGAACHRVRCTGLSAASEYSYEISVGERRLAKGREFSFRTPPPRGEGVLHIAALGDSGVATGSQTLVAEVIQGWAPEAILHTGDLDYLGDPDRSVFAPYADLLPNLCFFPARGNHDNTYAFEKFFFVPGEGPDHETTYYSFDWGSAHFVVLDTTVAFGAGTPGEEQVRFLETDLAAARAGDLPWVIVVAHSPIFTIGPHAVDAEMMPLRNLLAPIFDRYRVDLVLSGDDHIYHRSHPLRTRDEICPELDHPCDEEFQSPRCYDVIDAEQDPQFAYPGGTIYVVTGGGGAILYGALPDQMRCADGTSFTVDQQFSKLIVAKWHALRLKVSPAMLEVSAWSMLGELIDSFSISKLRLLRGDMDFSNDLSLTDAVAILNGLFRGQSPPCLAAGNADGQGRVNIADAVYLLNHLFQGGPPPVAPYPECGPLPEGAERSCERNGC